MSINRLNIKILNTSFPKNILQGHPRELTKNWRMITQHSKHLDWSYLAVSAPIPLPKGTNDNTVNSNQSGLVK